MANPRAAMPSNESGVMRRAALASLVLAGCLATALGAGVQETPSSGDCSTQAAARRQSACSNVVFHGPRALQRIALTFDACPRKHVELFSQDIVDYLKTEKIPATFFVSGKWAESCPDCLRQLEGAPYFEIALHGENHLRSTGLSEQAIAAEIVRNKSTLKRMGSDPQPFFRPPFGDCPASLAEVAHRLGVIPVMWDVDPDDPDPHKTPEILDKEILNSVRGGSIVALHVNGGGVWTAKALPQIVADLQERGFTFVTISDLLAH
jgi:peptidoglycan/xylan/chitin deacetylase (PgdA/CDA1 family)